jgi:hypothetical protein
MDWYREGGRQRSRVLYAFRGPTGARVGREALSQDVAKALELQHPTVAFDWAAIMAERQVIESAPEIRRRPPRSIETRTDPSPATEREAASQAPRPQPPGPGQGAPTQQRQAFPTSIEGATPQEQVAFLEQWYPTIRDRIMARASDPDRQQALLALAERLNVAGRVDAEAIAAGLPEAAEALERLALVFARRRRARRRPSDGGLTTSGGSQPPS